MIFWRTETDMRRLCVFGMSENLGGTEVYLMTLYRVLLSQKADIGFDFLVRHDAGVIPYEEEILKNGGRIFREYYNRGERNYPGYLEISDVLKKHPDWCGVYINVQNIHTAYRLIVESARMNLPYRIIHAHNSGYERQPTIKEKLYELYFHATVRHYATDLLACSEKAGKWMYKKESFTVVPDAVDFTGFRRNDEIRKNTRRELKIPEGAVVLGFCGRLENQKNPVFLADIFEQFRKLKPDSYLLIVGSGSLEHDVRERIRNYGISGQVILTGSVTDVKPYLQAMDAFVFPSRFEGFGISLLEAQAAGLRCYTTSGAVPEEVNQTGRVTFLNAAQPAEIWAETIVQAGFDREDCQDILRKSPYSTDALWNTFRTILNL